MTTLHLAAVETGTRMIQQQKQDDVLSGTERRQFRRYETEHQSIRIDRWNGNAQTSAVLGTVMDLSAGGVRLFQKGADVMLDRHVQGGINGCHDNLLCNRFRCRAVVLLL